jgi:hypothetical protein
LRRRQLGLRSSQRLDRRRPTRTPHKKFRLLCEGQVTEREYFLHVRQKLRGAVIELEVLEEHGVPLSLVQTAVERKRAALREARKMGEVGAEDDEFWCIFDTDRHPNIPQALDQANANGIGLAISNPCFELWALLHYQEQHAYLERDVAGEYLRVHVPDYEKRLPCEELLARYPAAFERARQLEAEHASAGSPKTENPSSGVWRLVEKLLQAARA